MPTFTTRRFGARLPNDATAEETLALPVFDAPMALPATLPMAVYCKFNQQMAEQFGLHYPSLSERASNRCLVEFQL